MQFLITRSEPHATQLAQQLTELGVSSTFAELMTIEPQPLSGSQRSHLLNLDLFDTIICVSANAAKTLAEFIDQYWPQLPVDLNWIAIGQATANTLAEHIPELSTSEIILPNGTDSEALLALPQLEQAKGKKVLLAKGVGGRDLIQQALTEAGATVTELELYKRTPAFQSSTSLVDALNQQPDFIQIASGDAFFCLLALLKQQQQDKKLITQQTGLWLVPSQRVSSILQEHGIPSHQVAVCDGASNQAIISFLSEQQKTQEHAQ